MRQEHVLWWGQTPHWLAQLRGTNPWERLDLAFHWVWPPPPWLGEIPPLGVPGTVDRKAHMEALVMGWPQPFSLVDPELLWPVERGWSYSICKDLVYHLNHKRPGHQGFLTTSSLSYKRGPTVRWCYNSGFPQRTMSPHLLASTGARS